MNAIDRIYSSVKSGEKTVSEIVFDTKIERTYVSKLLTKLKTEQKIVSKKIGRNVFYRVNTEKIFLEENLNLKNTHEDNIWLLAFKTLKNDRIFSEQALDILQFSFTEMLNNAIDHSKSGTGYVKIWRTDKTAYFIVRDFGIGIFKNVQTKKKLNTEYDAIQEILKGKFTTDPENHSGEGIFWTSKIADKITIESYNLRLIIDNLIGDYAIEELEKDEKVLGTKVTFEIFTNTEKSMYDLFHSFSFDSEKINLDTTILPIKLYQDGSEAWISRSQAKKILIGLEKFKKITFDFAGIRLIGQGFADEIFRVWQIKHPNIELEAINMNDIVSLLVTRAKNDYLSQ